MDPVTLMLHDNIKYNMRKSFDLDEDGCYLIPGNEESVEQCGFNTSAKTILIIHGWTVRNLSFKVSQIFRSFRSHRSKFN